MIDYPYQYLPPLPAEKYAELKKSIEEAGVLVAVEYDEHGNVLDGHHRLKACDELGVTEYPVTVRAGLSEDAKIRHVVTVNEARRAPDENNRRFAALKLRNENHRSLREIAAIVGVSHEAIREWCAGVNLVDTSEGDDEDDEEVLVCFRCGCDAEEIEPHGDIYQCNKCDAWSADLGALLLNRREYKERQKEDEEDRGVEWKVVGKDGKFYPATRPKSVIARSLQQADGAMKCLELTGWTEGERDTVTAGEVLREGNKTLAAISPNGHNALMTSESPEWYTPAPLIARVRRVLGGIDLDPCTSLKANETVQAAEFYTIEDDGLKQTWTGRVFLNPPYGSTIGDWVKKLTEEHRSGAVSKAIALVPARTDTAWFRLLRPYPRCFLSGRIQFGGPGDIGNSATFPSVMVALGCDLQEFHAAFCEIGDVYEYFKGGQS